MDKNEIKKQLAVLRDEERLLAKRIKKAQRNHRAVKPLRKQLDKNIGKQFSAGVEYEAVKNYEHDQRERKRRRQTAGKSRKRPQPAPIVSRARKTVSRNTRNAKTLGEGLQRETLIGSRELLIRGFWDRYEKSQQRGQFKKKYNHVPAKFRRGATAYDKLVQDYWSFTPTQRKHLRIRVAYGIIRETGEIIDSDISISRQLEIDLSVNPVKALEDLRTILVRAGSVDTPSYVKEDYDENEDEPEDIGIPVGIEWYSVND